MTFENEVSVTVKSSKKEQSKSVENIRVKKCLQKQQSGESSDKKCKPKPKLKAFNSLVLGKFEKKHSRVD